MFYRLSIIIPNERYNGGIQVTPYVDTCVLVVADSACERVEYPGNNDLFETHGRNAMPFVAPSKVPTSRASKLGFSESAVWQEGEREREKKCSPHESSFNFQIDPDLNRKRTPTT